MEIGKLPPQSVELEIAVLGAMLLEKDAVELVLPILRKESFYQDVNGWVFQAIKNLYDKNEPPDILTVTQELKRLGKLNDVGGSYYISSLTNRIASSANIEFHARIVEQKFMQRELIRICSESLYKAYEDTADVFDVIYNTDKSLSGIVNGLSSNVIKTVKEIRKEVIAECKYVNETGHKSGIPSSNNALNNQTNGWQKGDLIILGGRPGMGKTAAAIDFALHPALNEDQPTAFFSLEMSKEQIVSRMLSHVSSIDVQKIITKKLDSDDIRYLDSNTAVLDKVKLYIDDTPALTLFQLKNKARRLKKLYGIKLIVIDYLQLMSGDAKNRGNREQEISEISRGLKALAKELELPVIALSQVGRGCETKPSKEPTLSDLRESGAIEQDADIVIFCFRPEYYGFDDYDMGHYKEPAAGLFIYIIAKFRNGSPGKIKAKWNKELAMVYNF